MTPQEDARVLMALVDRHLRALLSRVNQVDGWRQSG